MIEALSPFVESTLTLTKLNGTYISKNSREGELAAEALIANAGYRTFAIVVVDAAAIPEPSRASEKVASTTYL